MTHARTGWYEDPTDATRIRWWSGSEWTEATKAWPLPVKDLPPPTSPMVLAPDATAAPDVLAPAVTPPVADEHIHLEPNVLVTRGVSEQVVVETPRARVAAERNVVPPVDETPSPTASAVMRGPTASPKVSTPTQTPAMAPEEPEKAGISTGRLLVRIALFGFLGILVLTIAVSVLSPRRDSTSSVNGAPAAARTPTASDWDEWFDRQWANGFASNASVRARLCELYRVDPASVAATASSNMWREAAPQLAPLIQQGLTKDVLDRGYVRNLAAMCG